MPNMTPMTIHRINDTREALRYVTYLLHNGYHFSVACHTDSVRIAAPQTALQPEEVPVLDSERRSK